jgi:hypothetical protein
MTPIENITRLALIAFFLSVLPALSVPHPRTDKTTVRGTIVDWTWRGKIDYEEEFEGLAFGHTIPSHYIIRLKLVKKRSDILNTINLYSRFLPIGIGIDDDDLKENEVIVYLPTARLKGLLKGVRITIENYSIAADDAGPVAESTNILINGKSPKP